MNYLIPFRHYPKPRSFPRFSICHGTHGTSWPAKDKFSTKFPSSSLLPSSHHPLMSLSLSITPDWKVCKMREIPRAEQTFQSVHHPLTSFSSDSMHKLRKIVFKITRTDAFLTYLLQTQRLFPKWSRIPCRAAAFYSSAHDHAIVNDLLRILGHY